MRRTLTTTLLLLAVATVAWAAYELPTRGRARIVAVVNELGNVLFGAVPGKVEVTNFPAPVGGGAAFTLYGTTSCPDGFTTVASGATYYGYPGGDAITMPGCWQSPPYFQGSVPVASGPCVVCVR